MATWRFFSSGSRTRDGNGVALRGALLDRERPLSFQQFRVGVLQCVATLLEARFDLRAIADDDYGHVVGGEAGSRRALYLWSALGVAAFVLGGIVAFLASDAHDPPVEVQQKH